MIKETTAYRFVCMYGGFSMEPCMFTAPVRDTRYAAECDKQEHERRMHTPKTPMCGKSIVVNGAPICCEFPVHSHGNHAAVWGELNICWR